MTFGVSATVGFYVRLKNRPHRIKTTSACTLVIELETLFPYSAMRSPADAIQRLQGNADARIRIVFLFVVFVTVFQTGLVDRTGGSWG